MYNFLRKISKSSLRPYFFSNFLIFFLNFFFPFRIFITNNHFGNASEEIFLNSYLSIKNKQKLCCLENFFFKSKFRNIELSNIYNKKVKYLPLFFKNTLSLIFSIEYLILRIAFLPLQLILKKTIYYTLLIEFLDLKYSGKKFRTSELNGINYKLYNDISKNWYFKKIKNEKKYLSDRFNINFKKKIILIHNRTSYFYKDKSYRNHDFKYFLPTLKWLLKKNFYVILFGENNIKFSNENLLNYYIQKNKKKIDDILLIKNCDHIICNTSGPTDLAFIFNKKIILVNHYNLLNPYFLNPDSYCLLPKIYFNKININNKITYLINCTDHRSGKIEKSNYKKLNSHEIFNIIKKIFTYKNFKKNKNIKKNNQIYKNSLLKFYQNTNDDFLKKDRFRYIFKTKNMNGSIITKKYV